MADDSDDDSHNESQHGLSDEEWLVRDIDSEEDRLEDEAMGDWWALTRAVQGARMTRLVVADHPPYMLGRYEALDTVTGGMGMVVIGRDPDLERNVAMKLWKAEGPAAEAALLAEARTLTRFKHPNIVSVFDVGKFKSSVYFVMESADGINGHDWIRDRAPSWQEVLEVFLAAGSGLAAAHVAGIAHRDFKPANMLVGDDGRVLVLDFGIAAALLSTNESSDRESAKSERGPTGAGTLAYMAPERLRGRPGDARSDQFSFCVSIWEALHRVRPHKGQTSDVLLEAIASGMIRTGGSTAQVPHWLSRVVRKGLSEDPRLRYRTMDELLTALREGSAGGEAVDGESGEVALSGGAGRLLNKPGTGAHGGSAELDALVDEVAKRLRSKSGAPNGEENVVAFAGDRFDPRQRQNRLLVFVSVISTVGVMFTLLVVGMMLRPPVAETPPVVPVVEDPLKLILKHVAADEFGKADALWYKEHRGNPSNGPKEGLSYGDSLAVARACLSRAREHESADPRMARVAAEMARYVAAVVRSSGHDSKVKEAGRQVHADADNLIRRLPALDTPTDI